MALSSGIVWEVRAGSSDNNGGGFKAGASGTDFSQQAGPQYSSTTGTTSAGASPTISTALAAADMVGNILHVTGGTSAVQGFFEIISVIPTVSITCDANVTTGVTSNLVFQIGGALGTVGKIGSNLANSGAVAGNTIWVKGSFTLTTNDTLAFVGTVTSPIRIVGYGTTRGDGYQGRTNGNGPLITTNLPTLAYNATFRMVTSGSFYILDCLNIPANVSNSAVQVPIDGAITRCRISNASTNAAAVAVAFPSRGILFNNDVLLTGGSGGNGAVNISAVNVIRIIGNRISGPGVGIMVGAAAAPTLAFNTVYGGTIPLSVTSTTATLTMLFNTLAGGSGDGVEVIANNTSLQCLIGNMVTDTGGFAFDFNSAAMPVFMAWNRTRDNTAGAINLATEWVAATNYSAVTTDTGGATSDYTDPASNDYRLISSSPAAGAGFPPPASIGALQRDASGAGGGGQKSYAFAT